MFIELKSKSEIAESRIGKIFVFSNIDFPAKKAPEVCEEDLCVFLNKAIPIRHYLDHRKTIVFHRSPSERYGEEDYGALHKYVFDAGSAGVPRDEIDDLRGSYDWNYPVDPKKTRSMTTGYMVVRHLEKIHPGKEIVLVNFGYGVKKSTYRCPLHNWEFEARELARFEHIVTDPVQPEEMVLDAVDNLLINKGA